MRMISTSSLISYSVGVRNLIKERQKYLFRSLLSKKFLGLVPRIFFTFSLFTLHSSLFSPNEEFFEVIGKSE